MSLSILYFICFLFRYYVSFQLENYETNKMEKVQQPIWLVPSYPLVAGYLQEVNTKLGIENSNIPNFLTRHLYFTSKIIYMKCYRYYLIFTCSFNFILIDKWSTNPGSTGKMSKLLDRM